MDYVLYIKLIIFLIYESVRVICSSLGYFSFHTGITDQQHYEQVAASETPMSKGGSSGGGRPKTAAIRHIFSDYAVIYQTLNNASGR